MSRGYFEANLDTGIGSCGLFACFSLTTDHLWRCLLLGNYFPLIQCRLHSVMSDSHKATCQASRDRLSETETAWVEYLNHCIGISLMLHIFRVSVKLHINWFEDMATSECPVFWSLGHKVYWMKILTSLMTSTPTKPSSTVIWSLMPKAHCKLRFQDVFFYLFNIWASLDLIHN